MITIITELEFLNRFQVTMEFS